MIFKLCFSEPWTFLSNCLEHQKGRAEGALNPHLHSNQKLHLVFLYIGIYNDILFG